MTVRWKLRVHAEGAQGIKATTGLGALDKKPDPYVIFVFGGVTKQCEPVENVEPVSFFSWPQAVVEFDVAEEVEFLQSSLAVHVKDRNLFIDRYIGGTSIPLAPLYTAKAGELLCQSKFFVLEYADEKFIKKKNSGEVKITMSVVDTLKKPDNIGASMPSEKETIPPLKTEPPSRGNETEKKNPDEQQTSTQTPSLNAETSRSEVQTHAADEPTKQIMQSPPASGPPVWREQKIVMDRAVESHAERQPTKRDLAARPGATLQLESPVVVEQKSQEQLSPVETKEPQNAAPRAKRSVVKSMKIELVSARNLTRPVSIGNFLDRKPDPLVTLEFCGISKSSPTLKDVDLKKPVEWSGVFLEFDLPQAITSSKFRKGCGPMTLVADVKDENLIKATYMGGGTLDLSSFFQPQSQDNGQPWIAAGTALEPSPIERVVQLTFSDEKLSKKKACGELTVRFHFICEEIVEVESVVEEEGEVMSSRRTTPALAGETDSTESIDEAKVAVETQKLTDKQDSSLPVTLPTEELAAPVKETVRDIKMLSIELLCGRDLLKPTIESLAESEMKSLFDRKPGPYAVLVLGAQTRKCAPLNNVDTAFFEWRNAIQIFELTSKPYPDHLLIHIYDDDIAGSDPYMGGARVAMQDIWDEASCRAALLPPADPQVVKTYQLNFIDEKMTMQKQCGTITVRFRWVYSDTPLPVEAVAVVPSSSELILPSTQSEDVPQPDVRVPAMLGFVFLRNMTIFNNKEVLDSSLDLYIEVSPFSLDASSHQGQSARVARSSVLDAATKGTEDTGSKLEWFRDELIVPICVPLDGEHPDVHIALKDMKNTEVASKAVRIKDLGTDISDGQFGTITVELVSSSNEEPKSTVKFQADVRFLAHSSPLVPVAGVEKAGGVITLFLVRSVFKPSPLAMESMLLSSTFTVAIDCQATKKAKGLFPVGKSDTVEFRTSSLPVTDSKILWWSAAEFPLNGKQVMTMKETEALNFEFQVRMTAGKLEKQIGSVLLNVFSQTFAATSSTHTQTIELGALGSMELEFAAGFRGLVEKKHKVPLNSKATTPIAPAVPSGDTHTTILSAATVDAAMTTTTTTSAGGFEPPVSLTPLDDGALAKEQPAAPPPPNDLGHQETRDASQSPGADRDTQRVGALTRVEVEMYDPTPVIRGYLAPDIDTDVNPAPRPITNPSPTQTSSSAHQPDSPPAEPIINAPPVATASDTDAPVMPTPEVMPVETPSVKQQPAIDPATVQLPSTQPSAPDQRVRDAWQLMFGSRYEEEPSAITTPAPLTATNHPQTKRSSLRRKLERGRQLDEQLHAVNPVPAPPVSPFLKPGCPTPLLKPAQTPQKPAAWLRLEERPFDTAGLSSTTVRFCVERAMHSTVLCLTQLHAIAQDEPLPVANELALGLFMAQWELDAIVHDLFHNATASSSASSDVAACNLRLHQREYADLPLNTLLQVSWFVPLDDFARLRVVVAQVARRHLSERKLAVLNAALHRHFVLRPQPGVRLQRLLLMVINGLAAPVKTASNQRVEDGHEDHSDQNSEDDLVNNLLRALRVVTPTTPLPLAEFMRLSPMDLILRLGITSVVVLQRLVYFRFLLESLAKEKTQQQNAWWMPGKSTTTSRRKHTQSDASSSTPIRSVSKSTRKRRPPSTVTQPQDTSTITETTQPTPSNQASHGSLPIPEEPPLPSNTDHHPVPPASTLADTLLAELSSALTTLKRVKPWVAEGQAAAASAEVNATRATVLAAETFQHSLALFRSPNADLPAEFFTKLRDFIATINALAAEYHVAPATESVTLKPPPPQVQRAGSDRFPPPYTPTGPAYWSFTPEFPSPVTAPASTTKVHATSSPGVGTYDVQRSDRLTFQQRRGFTFGKSGLPEPSPTPAKPASVVKRTESSTSLAPPPAYAHWETAAVDASVLAGEQTEDDVDKQVRDALRLQQSFALDDMVDRLVKSQRTTPDTQPLTARQRQPPAMTSRFVPSAKTAREPAPKQLPKKTPPTTHPIRAKPATAAIAIPQPDLHQPPKDHEPPADDAHLQWAARVKEFYHAKLKAATS